MGEVLAHAARRPGLVAVRRVVRELARLPDSPSPSTIARSTATGPTPRSPGLGGGLDAPGIPTRGRSASRHRCPIRRARHQAPRRLLPVADRGPRTRTDRGGAARATWWASSPRRFAARGCGSASTTRAGSTGRSTTAPSRTISDWCWPSPRRRLSRLRRRPAARTDRPLPPVVLWNDISWPALDAHLARLLADYYRAVPDGVVNDRWLAAQLGHGGAALAAGRGARSTSCLARLGRRRRPLHAAAAAALRRAHARVRACSPTARARSGSACAASTRASATTSSHGRGLPVARRARPLVRGHREQERQPAAQRRPARRGRGDPGAAARAARLARRLAPHQRRSDLRHPPVAARRGRDGREHSASVSRTRAGTVYALLLGRPTGGSVTLRDVTLPAARALASWAASRWRRCNRARTSCSRSRARCPTSPRTRSRSRAPRGDGRTATSRLEHLPCEQGVAGSSPAAPTPKCARAQAFSERPPLRRRLAVLGPALRVARPRPCASGTVRGTARSIHLPRTRAFRAPPSPRADPGR